LTAGIASVQASTTSAMQNKNSRERPCTTLVRTNRAYMSQTSLARWRGPIETKCPERGGANQSRIIMKHERHHDSCKTQIASRRSQSPSAPTFDDKSACCKTHTATSQSESQWDRKLLSRPGAEILMNSSKKHGAASWSNCSTEGTEPNGGAGPLRGSGPLSSQPLCLCLA